MNTRPVPFVDLQQQWRPIKEQALAAIAQVFDHGQFIMGPEVHQLETRLAETVGVSYAISCSSGTIALQMAMMALGIGPGDEVILPAYTFAAPLEVTLLLGAKAVLADIDPITYCIDPNAVARLITRNTKAIVGVSLYGQPADFEALNHLAACNGIAVIEDAAQSYGATQGERRSGNLSTMACTSFFPTKPLGGAGDGGAIFTNDANLAQTLREIRDHGQSSKYHHVRLGINGRLDSIACAILLTRLASVDDAIALRQQAAERYNTLLAHDAQQGLLQLPLTCSKNTSAFAQYVVQVDHRQPVIEHLQQAGIQTAIHYPIPLHQQPAYQDGVTFTDLTHSEAAAQRTLCLPIYPTLTIEQQELTVAALKAALQRARGH